jgi:hypothetical protein
MAVATAVALAMCVAGPETAAGASWTIQATAAGGELLGVSCTEQTACVGVGITAPPNPTPVAERWDGLNWAIEPTPTLVGSSSGLVSVSCVASAACTAVGFSIIAGATSVVAVAERWDGVRWAIETTPKLAGSSQLNKVSCSSERACTAIGHVPSGPLVERWNGVRWTIQKTPMAPHGLVAFLNGVSCASNTSCVAVGSLQSTAESAPLVERWNGRRWTIQKTPNPDPGYSAQLKDVSCSSQTACTAVGSGSNFFGATPLVERWNGRRWTIQNTPNPRRNVLMGVSCASNTSCVAVGRKSTATVGSLALTEAWTRAGWTLQYPPNPAKSANELDVVSCTSSRACTAVGSSQMLSGRPQALVERYS